MPEPSFLNAECELYVHKWLQVVVELELGWPVRGHT